MLKMPELKSLIQTWKFFAALEQRAHRLQQEVLRVSVEELLQGGEAFQGAVHVGRPHEKAHWRKATSLHGKLILFT